MNLYIYKIGTNIPALTIEDAAAYTADQVTAADGAVYSPLAEDCELSSLPDCSEALRAKWRREHPSAEERVEELEALVAGLLFGGNPADGGESA